MVPLQDDKYLPRPFKRNKYLPSRNLNKNLFLFVAEFRPVLIKLNNMIRLNSFILFHFFLLLAFLPSCEFNQEKDFLCLHKKEKATCGQFVGYLRTLPRIFRYRLQPSLPTPVYSKSIRQYEVLDKNSKKTIELNQLNYRSQNNNPPLKGLAQVSEWTKLSTPYTNPFIRETAYAKISPFLFDVYEKYLELGLKYPYESSNVLIFIENRFMTHYLLALDICKRDYNKLNLEEQKIFEESKAFLQAPKEQFKTLFLSNPIYLGELYRLNQLRTEAPVTTYADLEKILSLLLKEVRIIQGNPSLSNILFE